MEKEEINQEIKNLLIKIDNILEEEIKKEEFDVTKDKLNNLFNLIKENIDKIYSLSDKISINKSTISEKLDQIRKENFFNERLQIVFFKLHFIVKINKKNKYIIFKEQESFFIAYLIENFRDPYTIFNEFLIRLEVKKFNAYLEEYKLDGTFIEKLKRKEILTEKENIIEIRFFNCKYSSRFEEDLLKELSLENNLKKNKELQNKLKTLEDSSEKLESSLKNLENSSAKLENSLNNYKLEGVAILTIFIGIFTYLSANFSVFQNLLTKNYTGNLLIVITIFCIGLIPIIVLFLILKYLFFTPNNDKIIWNILGLVAFMCIIILVIIFSFNKLNINYDCDLEKLNEKIEIQEKQIEKLNDELNFLKNKNIFLQDQTLIIYRDDK